MKISVVIPAYNAAHFLPRSLGSVFAQTLQPLEVIVVDDGSTDSTAQVAEQLGAKVIRRPNGGLAAARNTGIQHASGDWIALLDADDSWSPEKLERQAACVRPDTVLVYTGARFFDDRGSRGEQRAVDPARARKLLRYCNPILPSSVLLRRQEALAAGGFREDTRTCEDWEMWVRMIPFGAFTAVDEPLTSYYVHPASLSASPERMLAGLKAILEPTLLAPYRGIERWIWRRRIWARQLISAALIARDNHLKGELRYALRSLLSWPSPFWESQRFAVFLVSLRNRLLSKRNPL
jgi:glycosyltransferase involved in cell wall biosynthesis